MRKALYYSKKLEAVGLRREQAEAHMEVLTEIFEDDVATKEDLNNLEYRLDLRFQSLEGKMENRFQSIENRFQKVDNRFQQIDQKLLHLEERIDQVTYKLINKVGMMTVLTIGFVATVFKFLI